MRNNEWITTIIEWNIGKKKGRDRPKTPFIKLLEDKGKST